MTALVMVVVVVVVEVVLVVVVVVLRRMLRYNLLKLRCFRLAAARVCLRSFKNSKPGTASYQARPSVVVLKCLVCLRQASVRGGWGRCLFVCWLPWGDFTEQGL